MNTEALKRLWETALQEVAEKHPYLVKKLDWFRANPQPREPMKKAA